MQVCNILQYCMLTNIRWFQRNRIKLKNMLTLTFLHKDKRRRMMRQMLQKKSLLCHGRMTGSMWSTTKPFSLYHKTVIASIPQNIGFVHCQRRTHKLVLLEYYLYIIRYLLLKYRLIFLWVLKVFDEPLGESNMERRVKISACVSKEGT